MKKIALITDQHFGCRNNSPYFLKKMLDFYDNIFFPYLIENNIKELLILGDTFDCRKTININILNTFDTFYFKRLEDLKINVTMILGNHDIFHRDTITINSINRLETQFKNIKIIKGFEDLEINGVTIGFCSWVVENKKPEFYTYLKSSKADILCGHFEINGFDMIQGHPCENGEQLNIFSKFKKVISGHFHVRSTKNNITYISNQIQMSWCDYELKKGFAVLDTSNLDITFIDNPVSIYEKILFTTVIDITKFDYQFYNHKIVRIYTNREHMKDRKFDLFLDKLANLVHKYEVMPLDSISLDLTQPIEYSNDTKKLIVNYIAALELKSNAKEIQDTLLSLYDEALVKNASDIS